MNADRKQAEEFVKNKLNEKTGQGITLYEHYLANDTTISIGTAVSWIVEFYQLSSPLPEITEEEIFAYTKVKRDEILHPAGANMGTGQITLGELSWCNICLDVTKHFIYMLSERKEQKTTEQHIPTDEEMIKDARAYAKEHSNVPDKYCSEWIMADYLAGAGNMREQLTGVLCNREKTMMQGITEENNPYDQGSIKKATDKFNKHYKK